MKNATTLILITALLSIAAQTSRANDDHPGLQFFACPYRVVGVNPDTQIPYHGYCRIKADGEGDFVMTRVFGGKKTFGIVVIKNFWTHEGTPIKRLVATFDEGGKSYEVTYTWRNSVDNHPLLTGDVVRVGAHDSYAEGFEMLRPIATTSDLHRSLLKELGAIKDPESDAGKSEAQRLKRLLRAISETDGGEQVSPQP